MCERGRENQGVVGYTGMKFPLKKKKNPEQQHSMFLASFSRLTGVSAKVKSCASHLTVMRRRQTEALHIASSVTIMLHGRWRVWRVIYRTEQWGLKKITHLSSRGWADLGYTKCAANRPKIHLQIKFGTQALSCRSAAKFLWKPVNLSFCYFTIIGSKSAIKKEKSASVLLIFGVKVKKKFH